MNHKTETEAMQDRIELLKAMHTIAKAFNDESDYEHWIICAVPDEPTEYDFEDIAESEEYTRECAEVFARIFRTSDLPDNLILCI